MSIGGGVTKLTLPHLNKDDEGLYTLRIWSKDGTAEHRAYLFVKGTHYVMHNLTITKITGRGTWLWKEYEIEGIITIQMDPPKNLCCVYLALRNKDLRANILKHWFWRAITFSLTLK